VPAGAIGASEVEGQLGPRLPSDRVDHRADIQVVDVAAIDSHDHLSHPAEAAALAISA
jgi:hypothetical protein